MREYLFRGKLAINNEWAFSRCPDGLLHSGVVGYDFIPETVGQYTGLTDKNGKRIFEGDIVKLAQSGKCYEVKYKSGCFCIGINWAISHEPDCEVIGNIHDNPELLEGGKHGL